MLDRHLLMTEIYIISKRPDVEESGLNYEKADLS